MMGATSGAGTAYPSGAFIIMLRQVIIVFYVFIELNEYQNHVQN
jgi:hypothetical protein